MPDHLPWPVSVSMLIAQLTVAASCQPPLDDPAGRARALERRLLAPCCRRQTLEDHDSELARMLRGEIRQRTVLGEAPDAIEDDLVHRYGEDIRAMPRGQDPRALLGMAIGGVVAAGALALARLAARQRARDRSAAAAPAGAPEDLAHQDRLDDELVDVD